MHCQKNRIELQILLFSIPTLALFFLVSSIAWGGDCTNFSCPHGKVCSYGNEKPICYCPEVLPLDTNLVVFECIPHDDIEARKAELNAVESVLNRDDLDLIFNSFKANNPNKHFATYFDLKGYHLRKRGGIIIGAGLGASVLGGLSTFLLYSSVDNLKESMMSLGGLSYVLFLIPPIVAGAGFFVATTGLSLFVRGTRMIKKVSPLLKSSVRVDYNPICFIVLLDNRNAPAGLGISIIL